jgi:hypothetical protein
MIDLDTLRIDHLGGLCPVQGGGALNGLPWYFRARHDSWQWAIAAAPHVDPVRVSLGWEQAGWATGGAWGEPGGQDAGYMDLADAERLIRESAATFATWVAQEAPPDAR